MLELSFIASPEGASVDLSEIRIGQPEELVAQVNARLRACLTVEEACGLFARELYERCTVGAEPSLVLSRIYLTLPFQRLPRALREQAEARSGALIAPAETFLALVGTHGAAPEWCDVRSSVGHSAIRLDRKTIDSAPMLARCFEQMGLDLDAVGRVEPGIHLESVGRSFGLFHVLHARGSPFVPAQADFVEPHGVESVLGCGTVLLDGAVSIWIGFSRHVIGPDQAMPLLPMMPVLWQTLQSMYRRDAIFGSEVRTGVEGESGRVLPGDRAEIAGLEDRLWAQQTALARVYAEVKVKEHALVRTVAALQRREQELSSLNRGLEARVAEQLGQLERSNALKRYLSPEIANMVLSGDAPAQQTRKRNVTIVFADIPTFEDLSSELESEELIDILSAYHREMTGVLFEHGGTLDKFVSTRIMGFFGDPIPQDDHAARAVRAGLALRDHFRKVRESWFPAAEPELQVGIHTGYATVGNVGSEYRVDYTVVGRNVTIASSLQLDAPHGEVIVSARTSELVRELFSLEPLKLPVRSSSRPIAAFRVMGLKAPTERVSRASPTRDGAMATGATMSLHAPAVGRKLGHYLLEELVGRGGMGQVFRAQDERLHRTVAIKVVATELSMDAKFTERFLREARALASLNSPYITQIYSISENEIPAYFAMEFVEGTTLRQLLDAKKRLAVEEAFDIFHRVTLGLAAAAAKGVIHRDVKPENVMISRSGDVKLTDFGLVKSAGGDARMTSVGVIFGTPYYMSPEQGRGEDIDFRSDMYSAGAMLFELLTGEPPFRGPSALHILHRHQETPLPDLHTLEMSISPPAYSLIQRLMAKRPEDRYPSYDALIAALEDSGLVPTSGAMSRRLRAP